MLAGLDKMTDFRVDALRSEARFLVAMASSVESGWVCAVWIQYLLKLHVCLHRSLLWMVIFLSVDSCQEGAKVFLSLLILILFKISCHRLRLIKAVLWLESQILCGIQRVVGLAIDSSEVPSLEVDDALEALV